MRESRPTPASRAAPPGQFQAGERWLAPQKRFCSGATEEGEPWSVGRGCCENHGGAAALPAPARRLNAAGPVRFSNPVPGGQTPIAGSDFLSFARVTACCPQAGIRPPSAARPLRWPIPFARRATAIGAPVAEMVFCRALGEEQPPYELPSPVRSQSRVPSPTALGRIALSHASWLRTGRTIQTECGPLRSSRPAHKHQQDRFLHRSSAPLPLRRRYSTHPAARFLRLAAPPKGIGSEADHRMYFYRAKTSRLFINVMLHPYKTKAAIILHASGQHFLTHTSSLSRIRHARMLKAFIESPRRAANRDRRSALARCSPW